MSEGDATSVKVTHKIIIVITNNSVLKKLNCLVNFMKFGNEDYCTCMVGLAKNYIKINEIQLDKLNISDDIDILQSLIYLTFINTLLLLNELEDDFWGIIGSIFNILKLKYILYIIDINRLR